MNMLGLAKRTRARFLISSTSEVYGDPIQHPQTEGYWGNVNPIGERSCYDEGEGVCAPHARQPHASATQPLGRASCAWRCCCRVCPCTQASVLPSA
jgi:hypothetical protein